LPEAYEREWEQSGRSFALLAGLEWKMLMDAFDDAERSISGDRWLNVRYEEFVDDPKTEMDRVLAFLELPALSDGASLKSWGVSASRKRAFADELGPDELARLNASLASHLERWGYQPG
jgi:hypothetical protein